MNDNPILKAPVLYWRVTNPDGTIAQEGFTVTSLAKATSLTSPDAKSAKDKEEREDGLDK